MLRLRIDDYPGAKPAEFDKHNLKNFLKFYDLLDKRVGKQFLLGVIPKHTADAELIFIGALPNVVVGMHGIDHDERFLNEFRNHLTTKDVTTKLKNSRERLQHLTKQNVDVYMPPHNIVDIRTLKACDQAGFKAFTSGPETDLFDFDGAPYRARELYSEAPLEYGRSDELLQRGSIKHLTDRCFAGETVYLTLHWTWEWNIGLEHLDRYLAELSGCFENFDWR
jgi:hypothetical protein